MLKIFLFVIYFSVVLGGTNDLLFGHSRVISGREAQPGQFPWMVAITITRTDNTIFCGGAIIRPNRILTAAHCVDGVVRRLSLSFGGVRLGSTEVGRQTLVITEIRADTIAIHDSYNSIYMEYDVAIIRLQNNIVFNDQIQPVVLPTVQLPTALEGVVGRVSGWGMENSNANGLSDILRWGDLTATNIACNSFPSIDRDIVICASGANNICHGDLGSPIVQYNELNPRLSTLIGIASFLHRNGCESTAPAGFTRISAADILNWINLQIQ